jgi:predicted homoserine dehydrogenase-like protein
MPAADSLRVGALPIGLAHNMVLKNDIPAGQAVRWSDVDFDASKEAVRVRREMEAIFARELGIVTEHKKAA